MYHYLGIDLNIRPGVYPPCDDSLLLANAIDPTGRILEVGTGSGIIAIHLARRGHRVVATDINPHAVACAKDNVRKNDVEGMVDVLRTDLMEGIKGPFDTIVFNPPYLPSRPLGELRGVGELEAITSLGRTFKAHELSCLGDRATVRTPATEETPNHDDGGGQSREGDEEEAEDPDDWYSRSWSGGKGGTEVIGRFMGELTSHLAEGGRGYIVVSNLTDLRLPPDSGLECRIVAERNFGLERLYVLEVFRREEERP